MTTVRTTPKFSPGANLEAELGAMPSLASRGEGTALELSKDRARGIAERMSPGDTGWLRFAFPNHYNYGAEATRKLRIASSSAREGDEEGMQTALDRVDAITPKIYGIEGLLTPLKTRAMKEWHAFQRDPQYFSNLYARLKDCLNR